MMWFHIHSLLPLKRKWRYLTDDLTMRVVVFCCLLCMVRASSSFKNRGERKCHLTNSSGASFHVVADLQQTVVLNCSSSGKIFNDSFKTEWKKDNRTLDFKSSLFRINNISRDDAANYECSIKNKTFRESCSVSLTVNAPPSVTIYTSGKVISGLFQLNCSVNAYPEPEIAWFQDSTPYSCSSKCESRHSEGQWHWNSIDLEEPDIHQKFTCVAKNTYGFSNYSALVPCYDEVSCSQWDESVQEDSLYCYTGETVSILCSLVSPSNLHFECFSSGVYHYNSSSNKNHEFSTKLKQDGPGEKQHLLLNYTIHNVTKDDGGLYTCYHNFSSVVEHKCPYPVIKNKWLIVLDHSPSKHQQKKHNIYIVIIVSVISILVGLLLVFWIFCWHKKRLKPQRFYDSVPELRWDVFVSYCSKDYDWVKELCQTLEQPPFQLTVCLHQRDWEIGRTILDNMADSIYCSQKTLLVVSKSYLESSFCMQELNIALDCEISTRNVQKDRIVVVKIDDVSVKKLPKSLRQKSHLDFSNSEQRKHFKTKLLRALPRRVLQKQSEDEKEQSEDEKEEKSEDEKEYDKKEEPQNESNGDEKPKENSSETTETTFERFEMQEYYLN